MSLLASASLILTPNGYKSEKLYSIVPASGNGDLTFTRATSASRVNSSGLIENVLTGVPRLDYLGSNASILVEPQRTNLISSSSTFTNPAWSRISITSVLNSTILSPDGTANSYKISRDSTSASSYIAKASTSSTGTIYTFSIYAKLGDVSTNFGIRTTATYPNRGDALFDLSRGILMGTSNGGTNTLTSGNIQSVGNGWYRCSVTTTFAGTGVNIQALISPTSLTNISGFEAADGALSNAYVWGAQLESGSYATSYIPTTTSTVTRNTDVISKTGISSLLNPSEGTFYVEIAALANDLTQRVIEITDNSDNNRVLISYHTASGNRLRFVMYGGGGNKNVEVTVADILSFTKCLLKWNSSGAFAFVNGTKYTLLGTSAVPTALDSITFSQWWGGTPFYGECKGLQVYKTALTDAECVTLTTQPTYSSYTNMASSLNYIIQ